MNFKSMLFALLALSFPLVSLCAQKEEINNVTLGFDDVDPEELMLIKQELKNSSALLLEILRTQKPGAAQSISNFIARMCKETLYITGALTLGGGTIVLAAGILIGFDNLKHALLDNPLGQATSLIALPSMLIGTIIAYMCLKLIFGHLLASPDRESACIKEVLPQIEQTINKLDCELHKIARLAKFAGPKA